MNIIIKFIIKNIYEKKFRTFLIIISIMLSSALFFASSAMTETMVKMFADRMKQSYGSTDIIIHANEKSPSSFFSTNGVDGFKDRLDFSIGLIQGSAAYKVSQEEKVNIQIYAFNIDELQRVNPVSFYNETGLHPFDGNKIILSKNTADKYHLKAGDTIDLNIAQTQIKFKVSALTYSTGLFIDESQSVFAIIPVETLASIYNVKGRVNTICIKTSDPTQKQAIMKELADVYKRYTVREPFTLDDLRQQTASMTTGFFLMSVVVILMSIFIIYTSFKVVTMERLPVIGAFRSIGATRRMTDAVLLVESLMYGVIGGAFGCILGLGILYIMAFISRPVGAVGFHATLSYTPAQMITAFMLAVALSFISCILPILKIAKIPIKDIVLNIMQKAVKKTTWKFFVGIAMLAAALVVPFYTPNSLALPVSSILMFLSIAAVVLLVPYITAFFTKIFERLYVVLFGNTGVLAAKNLRENKNILNNISLLAIGISSLLMINTISNSVVVEVANVYRGANFGIWMQYIQQGDRNVERIIRQVDGVSGTYGIFEEHNVELEDIKGARITLVQGIDTSKYLDYWNTDLSEDPVTLFKKLDEGRNIILSNTIGEKYGLKAGDTVTLRLKQTTRPYKIIGFMNTMMYNGSISLVSEMNLKVDTGNRFYSNIFIKTTSDPTTVSRDLKKQLAQRPHYMMTVTEMEDQNRKSNDNIFGILKGFSFMALIIGVFGILNNLMISFIERRRSLAILRSIGMNKKQTVGMIFIEALSSGLVGGVTGSIAGFFLIWDIPFVMKAINMPIPIHFPLESVLIYIAAGALITIAASISPAVKLSRLNIIDAIKYE